MYSVIKRLEQVGERRLLSIKKSRVKAAMYGIKLPALKISASDCFYMGCGS